MPFLLSGVSPVACVLQAYSLIRLELHLEVMSDTDIRLPPRIKRLRALPFSIPLSRSHHLDGP